MLQKKFILSSHILSNNLTFETVFIKDSSQNITKNEVKSKKLKSHCKFNIVQRVFSMHPFYP